MFKPMLSATADPDKLAALPYPMLASPKLDGFRCLVFDGVAYSRNMKPIRNRYVQAKLSKYDNLDGELIVGDPTDPHCLQNTSSGVTSFDGEPNFQLHCFDRPHAVGGFQIRLGMLENVTGWDDEFLEIVPHHPIYSIHELNMYETNRLAQGYEGVMLRSQGGGYKQGRATPREGTLFKLKRFIDGEAVILGFEEADENQNPAHLDELGRTKRTSHQANKVGKGMIGTIIVDDPTWGMMRLQPGIMPHFDRGAWWGMPHNIIGKTVHWRAFGYGIKDKPRFARFYGFREDL